MVTQLIYAKNLLTHERFSLTLLLLGIATLLFGISFYKFCRDRLRFFQLAKTLPGPPALPLLGNALQLATIADDSLEKLSSIVTQYSSPMRFWIGTELSVVFTEPRDYEIIMQNPNAQQKNWTYRFLATYAGSGLVTASGAYHRAQRKLVGPMHNAKALQSFIDTMNHHTRTCVKLLADENGKGEFSIQRYLAACTWDFVAESILGVQSSMQTSDDKTSIHLSERMYELGYERSTNVMYHSDYLFAFSSLAKEQKMVKDMIDKFILGAIIEKKKEYLESRKTGDNNIPKFVILEQLVESIMETKFMNDEEMRDSIWTVFTAAQDTTAVIASFALLHLAIDQRIQDKVREEINTVVGDDDDVTTDHLKDLKYTEMVIKEAIRLYPIGPVLQRVALDDISLGHCVIPKGCTITMVPFVTHRSDKYWDEPKKFWPERFLMENSNKRHQYAYVPFSYGIRSCIGPQYALTSIKVMLAHIIRTYRLTSTTKAENIRVKMDISVRSKVGYNVSLTRV